MCLGVQIQQLKDIYECASAIQSAFELFSGPHRATMARQPLAAPASTPFLAAAAWFATATATANATATGTATYVAVPSALSHRSLRSTPSLELG